MRENEGLRARLALPLEPIGASKVMAALRAQLEKLSQHDTCVLIQGEPGTGKETLARWLHEHGARGKGAFVAVAPGSIPREHLVAALFGAETADSVQPGLLEQANGGTLFLDEVAELDAELQQRRSASCSAAAWCAAAVATGGSDLRVMPRRHRIWKHWSKPANSARNSTTCSMWCRWPRPLRERGEDVPNCYA